MKNPCRECVVGPICKETCEEFVLYLKTKRPLFIGMSYQNIAWSFIGMAQRIRMGELELYNDNQNYRWRCKPCQNIFLH